MSAPELERGRAAYAQRAWTVCFDAFTAADRVRQLSADDLIPLAVAAHMSGYDEASERRRVHPGLSSVVPAAPTAGGRALRFLLWFTLGHDR